MPYPNPQWLCCMRYYFTLGRVIPRNYHIILKPSALIWKTRTHDDVIKWKHFPRYWPFVRGIHRSPVNSPHKGQWRVALMFSLIWAWINGWVNNGEASNLRRHRTHYDVNVMLIWKTRTRPLSLPRQCLSQWKETLHLPRLFSLSQILLSLI